MQPDILAFHIHVPQRQFLLFHTARADSSCTCVLLAAVLLSGMGQAALTRRNRVRSVFDVAGYRESDVVEILGTATSHV